MTALTLPSDFEAWAENEVAWGRAGDVASLAEEALADYRRRRDEAQLEAFRKTLDEARLSIRDGRGLTIDEVFDPIMDKLRSRL